MRRIWVLAALAVLVGGAGCGKKPAGDAGQASAKEISEFHSAVQDGDADILRRLLQAKPYLANAKNESGQSPLAVAKARGNEEAAEVIQKAGGHE